MVDARKAIFISGGGSGIGRAVAQRFAEQGWLVGLADVNRQGLDETARAAARGAIDLPCHGRARPRPVGGGAGRVAGVSGGRLDVQFNNAGIGTGGHFPDVDPADADRLIAINFGGVVNGVYAALPLLKATPGSVILNTGSASGYYGMAGLAVYSATKHAVRALTEALDIEFARYDIKVRDLMPGFIDTPLLSQNAPNANVPIRDRITAGGMEITPVATVAEAAWLAVHGDRLHTPVGPTAKRVAFLARWWPGLIVKNSRHADQIAQNQG